MATVEVEHGVEVGKQHEHNFAYRGVSYKNSDRGLPGTGAKQRFYAHVYYCTGCLAVRMDTIPSAETTYENPQGGATPDSRVPEREWVGHRW